MAADMTFQTSGKPFRKPGRPQKPLDPSDGPLAVLGQALRDLRQKCGDPKYRTLQRYARTPHQRLADAARAEQIPAWCVVLGYIRGCWEYYQDKHDGQSLLEGMGDLAPWRQLYLNAGGTLSGEGEREAEAPQPVVPLAAANATATGETASAGARSARARQWLPDGRRITWRQLIVVTGIACVGLAVSGVLLGAPGRARSAINNRRWNASECGF